MEKSVEILVRLRSMLDAVEALHEVPQGVRIQHESRSRHDVGPVAGLVLLQQKETLMLLRQQPLNRQLDTLGILPPQPAGTAAPIQECQRNQPPQSRIDAPQIPEIRFLPLQVNEFRNLSVRRLVFRQSVQTRRGRTFQQLVTGQRHPDCTHGGVPPEYRGITAFTGSRTGRGGQDAGGHQISLQ